MKIKKRWMIVIEVPDYNEGQRVLSHIDEYSRGPVPEAQLTWVKEMRAEREVKARKKGRK